MDNEELTSTIEEVKAQLKAKPENAEKSDDEIDEIMLDGFFKATTEGKMSLDDLEAIMGVLGYEFEDGIKDELQSGLSGGAEVGGATKAELEDTRTIGEGESKEDFKDKIDTIESKEEAVNPEEEEKEDEDEKASKLWGMELSKKSNSEDEDEDEEDIDIDVDEEEEEDEDKEREKASKLWGMDLRKN